jgi:hypothetical protein
MARHVFSSLVTVAAVLAGTLASPAAAARDSEPYYRAELVEPAPRDQLIAGGVLWLCEGTRCVAGRGTGRPAVMCKRLARETAAVVRFSFAGQDLAEDELQRCNG